MEKKSILPIVALVFTIVASGFIIAGQITTFFVNWAILKEMRLKKQIESNVKTV
ncbi:uncharacterized membrane protein YciS (DUF1049 family) [Arcicella sp. BE140]|uniref:hypothetical protein n=1 Tax=Arcicella sp. BE140 TaxID=2817847 RepID=UPI00285D1A4B|nr:hypothetical protein [Arcicella sp. BE140]MDR6564959.1 uncharacterized membrane protein YciS (DUF1049 family) [Arcicella sp. BE51]MDR6814749.1 uncharacterized membrane protein YciS (DUF1049 family) [Arcicella sp. BE140]MDR6826195.1 uncharacterized membrane protein YciS (DUF1049 family) [Arcicella sp. BE139]